MATDRQRPVTLSEVLMRQILVRWIRLYWRPQLIAHVPLPFERPCFVYGNHSNNMDPFILNRFTGWGDSTAGILTREYFRGRLLRRIMTDIDLVPTRKHIPEPHLIRTLYKKLDAGQSIVIYPEGGRRWDGRPLPWIEATAKIFVKSGVPIYPVLTHGSYVSWPRWATYPRPARLKIEVLPPLVFDRQTPMADAVSELKARIDFNEATVPEDIRPRRAYRPADGIHRLLYRDPDTGENGGVYTPDGEVVTNRAGTWRYRMQPDSTLLDERSGQIYTTPELFDRVLALPFTKGPDGTYARNRVLVHREKAFPDLVRLGHAEAALYDDAVRLTGEQIKETIPLDRIRFVNIERNAKLQMTLADEMVQLSFTGDGSALQWEHSLMRLLKPAPATNTQTR